MRVCFFKSDKPREHILADAFLEGCAKAGEEVSSRPLTNPVEIAKDVDVVCMVGVKSRELFRGHFSEGTHVVYLDKGYTRHAAAGPVKLWEYWRVAVDAHQPLRFLELANAPADRYETLGLTVAPWRTTGEHILLAGSSAKYHEFYGVSHPTVWTQKVVKHLRALTKRRIVYRPKPSWKEAIPVEGAEFSRAGLITEALEGAHALVTHGSNACFDALLAGVPTIALGPAVMKPISSTTLEEVELPRLASEAERMRLLYNLAYCQYTLTEMAAGLAWQHIKPQIYGG